MSEQNDGVFIKQQSVYVEEK